MGNKHYTQEELDIIKKEVIKSPTNLEKAFEKAAAKLNRTTSSVDNKYYRSIKNSDDKLFLTISSRKAATNTKLVHRGKQTKMLL